ncbi:hypothetical protein BT96DRAFT_998685 [Gymnopus androsaceus JB14]|uniref:Ribonuclease H1 N-terminal domain-containing protein n=1 Tax=Gymnopus androsaceus JB14 TaxID=1447944 RepID=A0A6A4H7N8_9AGAR|nr:hypothetical protein BT96DRAFT_998685 [Gymnopus androsaceus JB14]
MPSGQLELPPKAPKILKLVLEKEDLLDESEKMFYVLFNGIDHSHGVFTTYRTNSKAPGIEEHIKGHKNAVFKGFHTFDIAQNHYQEAEDTGILELLHYNAGPETLYIMIQGVKPGVGLLMKEGLLWRGGIAMSAVGTAAQGHAVFNWWQNNGKVRYLLPRCPFA